MYPELAAWRKAVAKADPEGRLQTDMVRRLKLRDAAMNETWIILGASSSMARAFARAVAGRGAAVLLCGRDLAELERAGRRCRTARRAPGPRRSAFDARDPASFAADRRAAPPIPTA